MIKISGLSKKYKNTDKLAVDNVSLEVKAGEVFGFLGPNGAGKSTTIKCMIGILPYESGKIEICGYNLHEDAVLAKKCMGYVPDDHIVYEKLTGKEYLNFMADIYGVSLNERRERSERLISLFDLENAINNPISSYSHGMKQKICVIGALISNPKVWVLDEPLTGLDPKSAHELKKLMREHCDKGNTVFFSSHVLEVVEKLCDRIAIINKGKIVAVMDIEAFQRDQSNVSLEEYFLELTEVENEIENNVENDISFE